MERFLLKQFAGSATNNGVFGSYQTGTPQSSSDVATIQSLAAWANGWLSATTSASKLPRLEEMQGLQYTLCKAIIENYREGIPEWISGETYYKGSVVSFADLNNSFNIYYNFTGTYTANNPVVDTANWRPVSSLFENSYRSNCIGSIPNKIHLSISNGVLSLKAGSILYVPKGSWSWTEVTIPSDVTLTSTTACSKSHLFYIEDDNELAVYDQVFCGTAAPTFTGTGVWWDIVNNLIKRSTDGGTTWDTVKLSAPLGLVTNDGNGFKEVNNVFNGIGFMSNYLFVLKGVTFLIPDGRNGDGTLKSIEYTTQNVYFGFSGASGWGGNWAFYIDSTDSTINAHPWELEYVSDDEPPVWAGTSYWYSPRNNYLYYTTDAGATWTQVQRMSFCYYEETSTIITSIEPKGVFEAMDRNSLIEIWARPNATPNNKNPSVIIDSGLVGSVYYIRFSGGTLIQWQPSVPSNTSAMTFAYPFIDTNYTIDANLTSGAAQYATVCESKTTTGFALNSYGGAVNSTKNWIAIGRWK